MRRFLDSVFTFLVMSFCVLALASQATAADHLNAIIQAMPANSWYTVPNSKLHEDPAEALDSEFPGIWQGNAREADGRFAWSGGALDSKRDRLVIWGGGHADYYGNELYGFNLKDFTWDRLTDPSPVCDPGGLNGNPPGDCADILSDGNPNARHTYYNLDYIPELDSLFSSPAGSTASRSGGLDRNTWLFDFEANEADRTAGWNNRGKALGNGDPNGTSIVGWSPTASAYDPNSGLVYSVSTAGLYEYNIETNFWRRLNSSNIVIPGGPSNASDRGMVIDPKRNKIVVIGHGQVTVYDLDGDMQYQQQVWETTGNEFQTAPGTGGYRPGVNYDPVADRIVVWDGDAVQALNMETREWEQLAATPELPEGTGTYGRFRYSPTQNAYIVVNGGDQDVLIYKLTEPPNLLEGDFDEDGDVDGADFLQWQRGGLSTSALADWETNFGATSLPAASTSVPEPSTGLILALCCGICAMRRRHTRAGGAAIR